MKYVASINTDKCDLCRECVEICASESLTLTQNKIHFNGETCTYCESCIDLCPTMAIAITYVR